MVRLSCFDSNDNPIESLYQWDARRIIKVFGATINVGMKYELHFANRRSDVALALDVFAQSGRDVLCDSDGYIMVDSDGNVITVRSEEPRTDIGLIAKIPLKLLEMPDTINIYVVELDDVSGERATIGELKMPMIPRNIPTDYVSIYTNNYGIVADGLQFGEDGYIYLSSNGTIFGDGARL